MARANNYKLAGIVDRLWTAQVTVPEACCCVLAGHQIAWEIENARNRWTFSARTRVLSKLHGRRTFACSSHESPAAIAPDPRRVQRGLRGRRDGRRCGVAAARA